jgi:hypothetical protein
MTDLLETFHVNRVDQSELEQLLQAHFGRAKAVTNREIHYGREDLDLKPALIVRYTKETARIATIEPHPGLALDDVAQIERKIHEQLLQSPGERIGQLVLFSSLAFNGWFRYRDRFQLIPLPSDAPRPILGISGHPLLMQFRFPGSDDMMIRLQRQSRVGRELELLCTALSMNIEGAIPITARYHWSLVGAQDPTNSRSEYCLEAYSWPGGSGQTAEFSSVKAWHPAPRLPHHDYYAVVGISVGQEMSLPETFDELFDAYFQRGPIEQERFLRAAHWHQFAHRAYGHSNSGSYSALITAVETLMGPEQASVKRCATCGRTTGGGSKRQFLNFVETYAPGPGITAQDRSRFYAVRSALAHGNRLLQFDRFTWSGLTPSYLDDWNTHRAMWLLVRTMMVNWIARAM